MPHRSSHSWRSADPESSHRHFLPRRYPAQRNSCRPAGRRENPGFPFLTRISPDHRSVCQTRSARARSTRKCLACCPACSRLVPCLAWRNFDPWCCRPADRPRRAADCCPAGSRSSYPRPVDLPALGIPVFPDSSWIGSRQAIARCRQPCRSARRTRSPCSRPGCLGRSPVHGMSWRDSGLWAGLCPSRSGTFPHRPWSRNLASPGTAVWYHHSDHPGSTRSHHC